jgi:hypothetical protein
MQEERRVMHACGGNTAEACMHAAGRKESLTCMLQEERRLSSESCMHAAGRK